MPATFSGPATLAVLDGGEFAPLGEVEAVEIRRRLSDEQRRAVEVLDERMREALRLGEKVRELEIDALLDRRRAITHG